MARTSWSMWWIVSWTVLLAACGTPPGTSSQDDAAEEDAAGGDSQAGDGQGTDAGSGDVAGTDTAGADAADAQADDAQPGDTATGDTETGDTATGDADTGADDGDTANGEDSADAGTDAEPTDTMPTDAMPTDALADDTASGDAVGDAGDPDVPGDDAADDTADAVEDGADAADADDAAEDTLTDADDVADSQDDAADSIDDAGQPTQTASAPVLTQLAVVGHAFVAPFDPQVHDYAVYCQAGVNPWQIDTAADATVTVTVLQPDAVVVDAAGSATMTVWEDEAVVVHAAGADGTSSDYWIRCLPNDFPHAQFVDSQPVAPGYYILGNTMLGSGKTGYAMVLDSRGTPVWYQKTGLGACLVTWLGPDLLGYSPLLGAAFGTNPTGHYTVLDLAANSTSSVASIGAPTDQHELLALPDGKYMVLSYPQLGGYDLSSRGVAATTILDCLIQEVNADGSLAWEWRASEHVDPVLESSEIAPSKVNGTDVADVFHCNSVAVDDAGHVLLSVRHTDSLFLIDKASGALLWKLGGTPQNLDGAPHIAITGDASGGIYHQHDARFLADGLIGVFDNHSNHPEPARGLDLAIDVSSGTASIVAEFTGPQTSAAMGSYRVLADGVRIIAWGLFLSGSFKPAMTEFAADGSVLRYLVLDKNAVPYRVEKVSLDALSLELLRAATAKPTP